MFLLAALPALAVSCGGGDPVPPSDPVSVVRIRLGEKIDGNCRFAEDLSRYPVAYRTNPENCWQAVGVGPLAIAELEQMKQEVPLFWEKSSPYQYALIGEWIDGECNFDTPAIQAFLEVSEIASTDKTDCHLIVNMGPVTQKQLDEIQRLGTTKSEPAVPAPSEPVPVPGQ